MDNKSNITFIIFIKIYQAWSFFIKTNEFELNLFQNESTKKNEERLVKEEKNCKTIMQMKNIYKYNINDWKNEFNCII